MEKCCCWIVQVSGSVCVQIVSLKFSKCVSYVHLVGSLQREHSKHDIADGHAAHQETTEEPLPVMMFPVDHSFFMMQGAK